KGNQAAAVEVTVTNTISRDQGYLKISKVFDPKTSGFAGTFTIHWSCDDGSSGDVSVSAGGSSTVGPFNTGTVCTVTEPNLPSAPTGWTFGTPSISGSPATIVKGTQAAAVEVTVTNTITRDQGTIIIKKISDPANTGSFQFTTTGAGYNGFTLPGGGQNSQTLDTGTYTATEGTQLGWILTGIGGSTDP